MEYSRTGSVIKGAERAKVKSMYEEDVYINNHSVGGILYHLFHGNRETAIHLVYRHLQPAYLQHLCLRLNFRSI